MNRLLAIAGLAGLAATAIAAPAMATQSPPIASKAELARYLHDTPPGTSPLDQLSPGGRKRFLAGLEFHENGLGGFSFDDPVHELGHEQIVRLFELFGAAQYADGLGLTPQEYARVRREREDDAKARGCTVATCPESEIEQRYDTFALRPRNPSLPHEASVEQARQLYGRLFAEYQTPQQLRAISRPDLRLLARAAGNALAFAPDAGLIAQLQMDLDEMQRRDMSSDRDFASLYRALVTDRQFARAAALARQHPRMDVEPLPRLDRDATLPQARPTALAIAADGSRMHRQAFDLSAPLRIVVVASCHFSQDAARAIQADPQLDALFARHAVWLADQRETIDSARDWNREFPDQPIHIAWRNDEWSRIDTWRMPTFYVFRQGRLVEKWSGWPADTGMRTLREKLREAGVPDPELGL